MIFGSPRQALAYAFACERGPGLARPKWHDAPRTTGNHHLDHVEVMALLYGRNPDGTPAPGCCGVERGSELDLDLRVWATERGTMRTNDVLAVERLLRRLMRAQGTLHERRRFRARRELDTGDGTPTLRAVGFDEPARNSLQRCPGYAQTSVVSDTCA